MRTLFPLHHATSIMTCVAAIVLAVVSIATSQAGNLVNNNQPVMQNTIRVFYIYWLPAGVVLDTSSPDGIGNFKTLLESFAGDAAGSAYLNIVTQYPGVCASSPCVTANGPGAFALGGSWTDTSAYPNSRGTKGNPLSDGDIQNEVTRAIAQNVWVPDANSIFFVITGVFASSGSEVEECSGGIFNRSCTFDTFCAYHDHFNSNGRDVHYGLLSDASFNTGCGEGISSGVNGQLASDRQVVLMSHELIESITDPQINTWLDDSGNEIGDKCNQVAATVAMNGHSYNVQQEWSNAASACVSSFGPSVKLTVFTGNDDLRGDSSVVAALQDTSSTGFGTFTVKAQADAGWGNNESHFAVGPFTGSSSSFARMALTLTSHNGFLENSDQWVIQSMNIQVLDSAGSTLCAQQLAGNPLATLNANSATSTFDTPNCLPPPPAQEAVLCHVFDDGNTNVSMSMGAVFTNANHQACIPDGTASGTCRKWFGMCATITTNRSVTMNIFNDGYSALVGPTDAVFINGQNQACKPDGTASGTCRKWFGRGQTNDGHAVTCKVFDDGNTNISGASDAVFVNGSRQSCIPDGTAHGECRRWWGACAVQ